MEELSQDKGEEWKDYYHIDKGYDLEIGPVEEWRTEPEHISSIIDRVMRRIDQR